MLKRCPMCGDWIAPETRRCGCGFNFELAATGWLADVTLEQPPVPAPPPAAPRSDPPFVMPYLDWPDRPPVVLQTEPPPPTQQVIRHATVPTVEADFAVEESVEDTPRYEQTSNESGRRAARLPFRSPLLGWVLKVVSLFAVGYVLFVVIPELGDPAKPGRLRSPVLQFVAVLLCWIALLPLYIGYRLCQRTIVPFRHNDTRPPIVYLRSFGDDAQSSLQPTGGVAAFHGLTPPFSTEMVGLGGKSLLSMRLTPQMLILGPIHPIRLLKLFLNADRYYSEELFGSVFRKIGPFVAIGRPGELLAAPGADRMYVRHDQWQQVVLNYLAQAQAVVLQPSKSPGVRWEVEQVLRGVPLQKVLLSMANFHGKADDYDEFRGWVAERTGVKLPPGISTLDRPCLIEFEDDGRARIQPVCYRSPLLWPFVVSGVDVGRTFGSFFRGLRGEPRGKPAVPRRHFGHKFLSVGLIVTLVLGTILTLAFGDRIADVVRNGRHSQPAPTETFTDYRGKAVRYTFRLGSDWTTRTKEGGGPQMEHSFESTRGYDLNVLAWSETDGPDDFEVNAMREALEEQFREEWGRGAKVMLTATDRVTCNGMEWLQYTFTARHPKQPGRIVRMRLYRNGNSAILIAAAAPDQEADRKEIDKVLDSFALSPAGP